MIMPSSVLLDIDLGLDLGQVPTRRGNLSGYGTTCADIRRHVGSSLMTVCVVVMSPVLPGTALGELAYEIKARAKVSEHPTHSYYQYPIPKLW